MIIGKGFKSVIINIDFESNINPIQRYCIPRRYRLLGQTTKQPLSNFEPQKLENISNFQGWGLTLIAYEKSKCN